MSDNGHKPQCEAITQAGARCRLPAQPGSRYCHIHVRTSGGTAAGDPAGDEPAAAAGDEEVLRQKLRAELRLLAQKVEGNRPRGLRPFTAEQVLNLLRKNLDRLSPELRASLLALIEENVDSEWLEPETWRGIGYVLQIALDEQAQFLKRRLRGEYEVDAWGYDPEIAEYLALVAGFFFNRYWRVELTGLEHVPNEGRGLLVANHSGVLPLDGAMIAYGVREQHPAHRLVRALVADWFPTLPFVSTLLTKSGQVLAHPDNGRRLLQEDELVLVFPEGYKGAAKPFKDRYQLARFGRGGFVRMAIESNAPIYPVSVVGAEETYPMLANAKPVARLFGLPYFPITPTWPWLGVFGAAPLPSKWFIDIGAPVTAEASDTSLPANPAYVNEIADLVRARVQAQIDRRLQARDSIFFG